MIEELLKKDRYAVEFQKLRKKLHERKLSMEDYEVTESVTLGWVLFNEDLVTREIISTLREKRYSAPTAIERKVLIDEKERLLYAFDWHEKILQGAIAGLLTETCEPGFSDSLHSYRKGRGQHNTLLKLSEYIKGLKDEPLVFILKKDIKSYGDNIPHESMFRMLARHVPEEDYLFEVLRKIFGFNYREWGTGLMKTKTRGLPTGSPLNNIMANLFLSDLDIGIDGFRDRSCYFRYGDDILVATPHKETAESISGLLSKVVASKELVFNEQKEGELVFDRTSSSDDRFKYLGLMVGADGTISLTAEKDQEIKAEVAGLLDKMHLMVSDTVGSREQEVEGLINSIKTLLYRTELFTRLTSYFPVVTDESYWKELDLWIARTLLSTVYKKIGDRVFAKYPFKDLRESGLPSIRHLRRLYLDDRGRFESLVQG